MSTRKATSLFCLLALLAAPVAAQDAASLQFSVAAPDPVMAGESVTLQTLVVNTGGSNWQKGSYYWSGEIYTIEGDERKFLAQVDPVTPQEAVAPGSAHGVQMHFVVPENMQGRRLLYRVFLIKDGKRIMDTDYKGFQVIEKEFRPPPPQDFKIGGDITLSYRNSSPDGWDNHQGVTAANLVGKIRQSSFLFNTYIIHTYHRPITPTIVLLNYYAPWGNLSVGDISPALTPLAMDGQGMRGVSFDRARGKLGVTAVIGRIVAPEEPGPVTSGRFARYTGAFKAAWQFTPDFRASANAVMSRDDEHSISITTTSNTLEPQENMVYGVSAEWKFLRKFTFLTDYQMSTHRENMRVSGSESGSAWKQELRFRVPLLTARGALSRVDPKFAAFASPSVIADRSVMDMEFNFFPIEWDTLTLAYNSYTDNLDSDPGKTTTEQSQVTVSNALKIAGKTLVNTSMIVNTTVGKPAGVQDNQTSTLNLSLTQPWGAHTLNVGLQSSAFTDNTKISHDLDTNLFSLSGAFRLGKRLNASLGLVSSETKDKVDSTSATNDSLTGNFSYAIPRRPMAVQFWVTLSSAKNDSLLYPADNSTLTVNGELVWLKKQGSRLTFGAGLTQKTDSLNPAADSSELNLLTRYNYSF